MDIEDVKRYIEGNLKSVCGLSSISSRYKVSTETLRKEFRRTEKIPISQFISAARIEQAKNLLGHTDMSCFEV